jgi:hypothetical protein
MNAAKTVAEKALRSYCGRYATNRPFGAPEQPSLVVAFESFMGQGYAIYNRDGGGTIALAGSYEAGRALVYRVTGRWP